MSKSVYVIHDTKSSSFSLFGLFSTHEEAKRTLAVNILRNPDIMPAMYPGDFSLFAVAGFFPSGEDVPVIPYKAIVNCGTVAQILSEYTPKPIQPISEPIEKTEENE